MDLIELADGTKFEGYVSHYMYQIWIHMTVECAAEQMLNLIDKSKTNVIVEHGTVKDVSYIGYTQFDHVKLKEDGSALFYLTGDENSHIEEQWTVPIEYLPKELRKDTEIQNGREEDIGRSEADENASADNQPSDGNDETDRGTDPDGDRQSGAD